MSEQKLRDSRWKSRVLAGTTAATFAIAGLASFGAPPAQAASKWVFGTQVYTSSSKDCKSVGDRRATKQANGCWLSDAADGTIFLWDSGGKAAKLEIFKGTTLVGKVEFHPQGEWLWVADTANDGDTIYVRRAGGEAIYAPPQTSKKLDQEDFNLEGKDGNTYTYNVYDRRVGNNLYDKIGSITGVA